MKDIDQLREACDDRLIEAEGKAISEQKKMPSGVHFDQNGIEIRWHSGGNGQSGCMSITIGDNETGRPARVYIEDLEVINELITALEKLRDS